MSLKIGQTRASLVISPARKRQTPPPRVTFRKVMEGGARILAAGARVASQMVGGPLLAAAVTGGTATASPGMGLPGVSPGQDPLSTLQSQRLGDDLQLLALQEKIQRDNRQIALVSNVMKARHDTAKAAISNIRA